MVLGTLKQLEALVKSLGILIGHCHRIRWVHKADLRGWHVNHGCPGYAKIDR